MKSCNAMLYYVNKNNYNDEEFKELIMKHKNIRFVSLVGVDLGGNATDEKIPIEFFLDDV